MSLEHDAATPAECPRWCVVAHGSVLGEDDWLHLSPPLNGRHDGVAQLCMSIDPHTGQVDGPYVLVGANEFSAQAAERLGVALLKLVGAAALLAPEQFEGALAVTDG
jgi:hypothetical protein